MPVPGGEITTSEILVPEVVLDAALAAADAEEAVELTQDDLPELS